MGMKCANCGKGVMYGHNVSHAKNRTRKVFKPNLHTARITIGGTSKRLRLCTKCLRMIKRATAASEKRQATDAEKAAITNETGVVVAEQAAV
jgi:large subunit ribosomal protein L28